MPHLKNYHQQPPWIRKEKLAIKNGEKNLIVGPNGDRYVGEWKNNQKHGHGVQIWNGKKKFVYRGTWENGKRSGYGTLSFYDHKRKRHECIYGGNWMNGERNGWGINRYPGGAVYEGNWTNNKRHGAGRMWYPNGHIYNGYWKNDQRWSEGYMKNADGAEYVGNWKNDKRHGYGIVNENDEKWFEGYWVNDEKHGVGRTFIYTTKYEMEGLWIRDEFCCGTMADMLDEETDDFQPTKDHPIPECGVAEPEKIVEDGVETLREKIHDKERSKNSRLQLVFPVKK